MRQVGKALWSRGDEPTVSSDRQLSARQQHNYTTIQTAQLHSYTTAQLHNYTTAQIHNPKCSLICKAMPRQLHFKTPLNVMCCAVVLHRWTGYIALHQIKLNRCTALFLALYTPAAAARLLFPLLNFDSGELTSGGYCRPCHQFLLALTVFPTNAFTEHLYQTKPSFPLVLIAKLTTITSTNANISYVYHLIIISQSPLAPHVALICLHEFVSGWDVR